MQGRCAGSPPGSCVRSLCPSAGPMPGRPVASALVGRRGRHAAPSVRPFLFGRRRRFSRTEQSSCAAVPGGRGQGRTTVAPKVQSGNRRIGRRGWDFEHGCDCSRARLVVEALAFRGESLEPATTADSDAPSSHPGATSAQRGTACRPSPRLLFRIFCPCRPHEPPGQLRRNVGPHVDPRPRLLFQIFCLCRPHDPPGRLRRNVGLAPPLGRGWGIGGDR